MRRIKPSSLFLLTLILLFLFLHVNPVSAVSIGVTEWKLNFGLMNPGETSMLNTTVVNMGDEPIEVDVRKEGEIAEWIVVSSSAFNMSGREEKTITFTLSVPQTDLEPGDHYCYIVVVGYPANVSGGDVGVRVGNGIRLTAWVQLPGEVVKSGEIIQFKAADVERGQIAEFEVTFQATGTVHVDAFPKVWISRDNAVVDVVEGGKVMVMPGETKKLTAKWNTTDAALGEYQAVVRVFYDNNTTTEFSDAFTVGVETGEITVFAALDVRKGETAEFKIVFRNTGTMAVSTKAILTITDSVSNPIKTFESISETVNPREEHLFTFQWDTNEASPGHYIAKATVQYDGKRTPEKTAVFDVLPETPNIIIYAAIAAVSITVLGVVILTMKRRRAL
jgi:hypothetical protein